MLCQRVQRWHQRVSLFATLALRDGVGGPLPINPRVGAGRAIELAGVGEKRVELRPREEALQHGLPGHVVVGTTGVHRQDGCTRVDLRGSPQDTRKGLTAGSRA